MTNLAAILGAADGAPTALPRSFEAAEWDALLVHAGALDLMPALWPAVRRLGLVDAVPEALVEALGQEGAPRHHPGAVLELAHRRNATRSTDLLDQLESVLAGFAPLGIEVVALKGAAHLVGGTWPDPAQRAMSDLDLLVDPGAARAAVRQLEGLGYVASEHPGEAGGDHHHLAPMRHPDRFGSIELHVQPLQRGWRHAADVVELWADARVVAWRGQRIGVPSGVDTAVISLVHGYLADLARYQARVPLRMVHELWRFDRRGGPVDWDSVRVRLELIGWSSLVDDYRATVEALFADRAAQGSVPANPVAEPAARARVGVALALAERPGAARALEVGLRARSSLDEGRLRRHYGTAIDGRWRLRLHHLARQLPAPVRPADPTPSSPRPVVGPARPSGRSRASGRPRALLVTPELPARRGNGLAMRADVALSALLEVAEVTVLLIDRARPATSAGGLPTTRRAPMGSPPDRERAALEGWIESRVERLIVYRPEPVDDQAAARSWLGTADARVQLRALEPLSESGRLAHPAAVADLAATVRDQAGEPTGSPADGSGAEGRGPDASGAEGVGFDLVHLVRLRMAPWAEPFAFRPGVTTVLDFDDDEVTTHTRLASTARQRGELDLADHLSAEADALGRLADWYAPRATVVTVASPDDVAPAAGGAGVGDGVARHRPRHVEVVPNAIGVGHDLARRRAHRADLDARRSHVRLLLVGNFTYAPNRWAAEILVDQIRPALAARLDRPIQVDLVGAAPTSFDRFRSEPGVRVAGRVFPLDGAYDDASLVVVPLAPAGGTRIKVLEAFALLVPVVATPGAVEGLGVVDGVHALVADGVDGLVDACARALADPVATQARAERAWELVSAFDRDRVADRLAAHYRTWLGLGAGVSPS
jgi:glycosyltransferase involved in cell wall biosynthesis